MLLRTGMRHTIITGFLIALAAGVVLSGGQVTLASPDSIWLLRFAIYACFALAAVLAVLGFWRRPSLKAKAPEKNVYFQGPVTIAVPADKALAQAPPLPGSDAVSVKAYIKVRREPLEVLNGYGVSSVADYGVNDFSIVLTAPLDNPDSAAIRISGEGSGTFMLRVKTANYFRINFDGDEAGVVEIWIVTGKEKAWLLTP